MVCRPNFASKGKVQRDRRKLREKRRSTGVVHLQSTEVQFSSNIELRHDNSTFSFYLIVDR